MQYVNCITQLSDKKLIFAHSLGTLILFDPQTHNFDSLNLLEFITKRVVILPNDNIAFISENRLKIYDLNIKTFVYNKPIDLKMNDDEIFIKMNLI